MRISTLQVQETIERLVNESMPGLLFFEDFDKAFDSISHKYILHSKRFFNFRTDIIEWVIFFIREQIVACKMQVLCPISSLLIEV